MEQFNISNMSITELKAAAFDIICQLEVLQRNLKTIHQEIEIKSKELKESDELAK